jgi:hypothetical protein
LKKGIKELKCHIATQASFGPVIDVFRTPVISGQGGASVQAKDSYNDRRIPLAMLGEELIDDLSRVWQVPGMGIQTGIHL